MTPTEGRRSNLACQRCGNHFECNSLDVSNCQCSTVTLSSGTISFLEKTHFDCLCKNCLSHFNQLIESIKNEDFPKIAHEFMAGIHYTIENGNWVFTERYHLLRGNCCANGCRNCPYGYKVFSSTD